MVKKRRRNLKRGHSFLYILSDKEKDINHLKLRSELTSKYLSIFIVFRIFSKHFFYIILAKGSCKWLHDLLCRRCFTFGQPVIKLIKTKTILVWGDVWNNKTMNSEEQASKQAQEPKNGYNVRVQMKWAYSIAHLYEPIKCLAGVFVRWNEAECSRYSNSGISLGIYFIIQWSIGNQWQSDSAGRYEKSLQGCFHNRTFRVKQENPKQMIESNNRVSHYKDHKIMRTREIVSSPKKQFF